MNAAIFFGGEDVVADGEKICVAIDELEGEHGEALHHTLTGCHPELWRSRSEGPYVRGRRQCREMGRHDACRGMEPNKLNCRRVMSYGPSKGWCLRRMTKIRR